MATTLVRIRGLHDIPTMSKSTERHRVATRAIVRSNCRKFKAHTVDTIERQMARMLHMKRQIDEQWHQHEQALKERCDELNLPYYPGRQKKEE